MVRTRVPSFFFKLFDYKILLLKIISKFFKSQTNFAIKYAFLVEDTELNN